MAEQKKAVWQERLLRLSEKLAKENHLRAIRDAFLFTIPFLVLSGFMVFIAWVALVDGSWLATHLPKGLVSALSTIAAKATDGGNNIYSLLMVFLVSYNLSKNKGCKTPLMPAAVSVGAFMIMLPSALSSEYLGLHGMFMALVTSLLVTEAFLALSKIDALHMKISGDVPPAIIESFSDMIIIIIIHLACAALSWLSTSLTEMAIPDLINAVIQKPMVGVSTNLLTFLLSFGIGQDLCYFLGVHPAGVINPIFEPALTVAISENNAAWIAGETIPHIISLPFRDIYGTLGGISNTLGLTIAIFIFAKKRRDMHDVAKLAVGTEIFNINEPILFGLPIVYNPLMFVPFCLTTSICYVLAYLATAAGLIGHLVVFTSWSTPIFLSAYVASGGDWRNVAFQVLLLALSTLTYVPFVKMMDNQVIESGVEEEEAIVFDASDLDF